MPERLQKVLAQLGVASRRKVEEWIREGRISINGAKAQLGDKVTLNDKIKVDNKLVSLNPLKSFKTRVLLYHKPVGEICAQTDPEGRPTIYENLPKLNKSKWISIGRLDFNTSGLLILTNDGQLANNYMHPKFELEREYAVRVLGEVSNEKLTALLQGVTLEDGPAHFKSIQVKGGTGRNQWYYVVVTEGRNRIVRRLFESQNIAVNRLVRVGFDKIALPEDLKPGRFVELSEKEIRRIYK